MSVLDLQHDFSTSHGNRKPGLFPSLCSLAFIALDGCRDDIAILVLRAPVCTLSSQIAYADTQYEYLLRRSALNYQTGSLH
jgi:hypothetical protein